MTPKAIILAPRYSDEIVADAYMAKSCATANENYPPEHQIEVYADLGGKSSLINMGFNRLFAEALNQYDDGNIQYMAMQHADVVAEPGWLNKLYAIMKERGDVAVSAVVCIKETERLRTSCAVGNALDKFDIRRYINVTDRHGLPETFSTIDVAKDEDEVLLINTGLWIADLSWQGWNEFAFESIDAIFVNPATNKRQAATVPEDWFMSYYLAERGAPYSATWKVRTHHYGPTIWDSHAMPPVYPKFVANGSAS